MRMLHSRLSMLVHVAVSADTWAGCICSGRDEEVPRLCRLWRSSDCEVASASGAACQEYGVGFYVKVG